MYSGLQLHEFYSEPMPRYLVGRLPDFDFELLQLQELVLMLFPQVPEQMRET